MALRLAAAAEQESAHPGARHPGRGRDARPFLPPAAESGAVAGRAAQAVVEGRRISVSSPRHAAEAGATLDDARVGALEAEGKTVVAVLADGLPLALIALRDEPREDAAAGIAALRRLGLRPVMLTGDNPRTGAAIAGRLGMEVEAGLLPADKLRHIGLLRQAGPVAMVGMASMMPRRWRRPRSASPWAAAPMWRWRPRMPPCCAARWEGWRSWCSSPAPPCPM
ncbi:HAD family hydrolase [Pseudoroseomonas wenyumeiae]